MSRFANVALPILLTFVLLLTPHFLQARPAPESFADLVEALMPTVVNISTSQTVENNGGFEGLPPNLFPPDHPFEEFNNFFDRFAPQEGGDGPRPEKLTSLGSGFIIDSSGFVATNYHVIENAEEITITLSNEEQYDAEIIGFDVKTDLAVLKIDTEGKNVRFNAVKFGDSDHSRVGDWVIAIGNPFNLGGTVTAGIISARARDINAGPFDDFIQTDAAINRGNSGGPMFDIEGNVIGVNTAIYSPSGGSVGIGFAVPSTMAQPILDKLKKGESIKRGWLGVKIQRVTEDIADSLGLKDEKGALVVEVLEDSPALKAGVKQGDVILEFDGKEVETMRKLPRHVAETDVGKRVSMVVWREGVRQNVSVTLGELKDEKLEATPKIPPADEKDDGDAEISLGMSMLELTSKWRNRYNISDDIEGLLVVKVDTSSHAYEKGIRRGDIVVEVNQKKVEDVEDVEDIATDAMKSGRKSVLLLVQRGGEKLFIALPINGKK